MASSSSSERGRLRSSMSRSHLAALYCSGVRGTPARWSWLGVGVSIPIPPIGVAPGVMPPNMEGVAPPTEGVADPMDTGVSSHRDRVRLGVGVTPMPPALGVESHCPGVAPGVASAAPATGVSSQRFLRPGVGVAASQRLPPAPPGVESGASHSDTLAFFSPPPWSHRFLRFSDALPGAPGGGPGGATPEARVGTLASRPLSLSSFCLSRMLIIVCSFSRASACSRITSPYVRTSCPGVLSPIANASLRAGESTRASRRFR
mmetsp:Transcript_62066/g.196242  ORF Transcript_62066/g.196242 Transcript_62066/m.196242 type:complete len:261 (-) Transcript_62066:350-1132(-)